MKKAFLIAVVIFGALAVNAQSVCTNVDFELTTPGSYPGATNSLAVQGWTLTSQQVTSCTQNNLWNPGSSEFSVMATPVITPTIGTITNSPLGGARIVCLNTWNQPNYGATKLARTFPVTSANTFFQFAYAGMWDNSGHLCCESPKFRVNVKDANGNLTCSSLDLSTFTCSTGVTYTIAGGVSWTNWMVKNIDLTPYIGTAVTIEVINQDCIYGGHSSTVYFDAKCGNSGSLGGCNCNQLNLPVGVNYCAGTTQAVLQAPAGYLTYSWVAPGGTLSPSQATLSAITITNPVLNSTYTVNASNGTCQVSITYTIVYTSVNASGLAVTDACQMNANGSATVVGSGSGMGYNYVWTNSSNSVISTASVAANLAPGVYTVVLSASPGCGTAAITATVINAPPTVNNVIKPYCFGQPAYLIAGPGLNYQWYNGFSPIAGGQGTAPAFTVTSPSQNAVYKVAYTTPMGCRDSVSYSLNATNPGTVGISSSQMACPGGFNGSAVISLTPVANGQSTNNAFVVFSANTITPAYNSSISPTPLNTFTAGGLYANGSYSVSAFDGSCYYGTTFIASSMPPFDFTITPAGSPTICNGNTLPVAASFSSAPGAQYTYSWSPATFILGNQTTFPNIFISPTTAPGVTSTHNYSVTVTPTVMNCPLTKTIALSVAYPLTPTITAIPSLCSNSPTLQVIANPPGGYFSGNTAVSPAGVLSPSASNTGANTLLYSNAVSTCVATSSASFTVNPEPPVSISGNLNICAGQSTTLTASGANTYSWSTGATGPVLVINPAGSMSLQVIGTSTAACSSVAGVNVQAVPIPTLGISGNLQVCAGKSTTLLASGAATYTWNTGAVTSSISLSPAQTSSYSLIGANSPYCKDTAQLMVTVNPNPTVSVSGNYTVCAGEDVLLTASGADNYTWDNMMTGDSILVNPMQSTSYVATGFYSLSGCSGSGSITVLVDACTGIAESAAGAILTLYPNPVSGVLYLVCNERVTVRVYSGSGQLILNTTFDKGGQEVDTGNWPAGLYIVKAEGNSGTRVIKILKNE